MSLFRPWPFFPCPPPGPQSCLGPQDTLAETLEECRSLSSQRAQATAAPGTRASGTLAFTLVIHVPNSGLGAGDVIVYAKHLQRASHCIPFDLILTAKEIIKTIAVNIYCAPILCGSYALSYLQI